jgi:hypothetical protein
MQTQPRTQEKYDHADQADRGQLYMKQEMYDSTSYIDEDFGWSLIYKRTHALAIDDDDPFRAFNVTLDAGPEIPPVVAGSPPANGYAIIEFSGPNFVAYKVFVNNGVEVTQVISLSLCDVSSVTKQP